jgi:hypothetical protein
MPQDIWQVAHVPVSRLRMDSGVSRSRFWDLGRTLCRSRPPRRRCLQIIILRWRILANRRPLSNLHSSPETSCATSKKPSKTSLSRIENPHLSPFILRISTTKQTTYPNIQPQNRPSVFYGETVKPFLTDLISTIYTTPLYGNT